jgi:hypothetical protein
MGNILKGKGKQNAGEAPKKEVSQLPTDGGSPSKKRKLHEENNNCTANSYSKLQTPKRIPYLDLSLSLDNQLSPQSPTSPDQGVTADDSVGVTDSEELNQNYNEKLSIDDFELLKVFFGHLALSIHVV